MNLHSIAVLTNDSTFRVANIYFLLIIYYWTHIVAWFLILWDVKHNCTGLSCQKAMTVTFLTDWFLKYLVQPERECIFFEWCITLIYFYTGNIITVDFEMEWLTVFHLFIWVSLYVTQSVKHTQRVRCWLNYKCWHSLWKAELGCFQPQSGSLMLHLVCGKPSTVASDFIRLCLHSKGISQD